MTEPFTAFRLVLELFVAGLILGTATTLAITAVGHILRRGR